MLTALWFNEYAVDSWAVIGRYVESVMLAVVGLRGGKFRHEKHEKYAIAAEILL